MTKRKKVSIILGYVFLAWVLLAASIYSHCATSQPRLNGLGVLQEYDSPYMYMVGAPMRVNVFEDRSRYFTYVEFKPLGASALNTVPIMFCDNDEEVFSDGRLHVVTYRIRATRKYQGIGCHDILPGDLGVFVMEDNQ